MSSRGDRHGLFWISADGAPPESLNNGAANDTIVSRVVYTGAALEDGRRTIQGIAAHVIETIRAAQQSGPYYLGGWSLGGVVAYEIANQLLGADEAVAFLAVADSEWVRWSGGQLRVRMEPGDGESPISGSAGQEVAASGCKVSRAASDYYPRRCQLEVHLVKLSGVPSPSDGIGWRTLLEPGEVRLAESSVEREDGRDEQLAVLMQAVTEASHVDAGASEAACLQPYSAVMTIQAGRPGGVPVFCVPGAGASITDFVPFSDVLDSRSPIHSFQPRGMDGVLVPHCTVEAAARMYCRDMMGMYPGTEFVLAGHSFGGWVAFEMALQLKSAGRGVQALTLLDSDCPGPAEEYTHSAALLKLVASYELAAERAFDVSPAVFKGGNLDAHLTVLHRCLVQARLLPQRSTREALRGPLRTFEAALRARYVPRHVFDGPVTLVLVPEAGETLTMTEKRFAIVADGWRRIAPHLQVKRGTGNHLTLLRRPNIDAVARWVLGALTVGMQPAASKLSLINAADSGHRSLVGRGPQDASEG